MNKLNFIMLIFYLIVTFTMITIVHSPNMHPVNLTLMLIVFSSSVCMIISLPMKNSILSIMMFMIMISGVLIIFMYFSSLISNQQSKMKINMIFIWMLMLIIMGMSIPSFFTQINLNKEVCSLNQTNESMFTNIKMIYEYPFSNLSIKCMMMLLMSLLAIIKTLSSKSLTLRKIS